MMKNKIATLRRKKGLTLLDISILSGLSSGYICHLEKGSRNNPSLKSMEKISKALGEEISKVFYN